MQTITKTIESIAHLPKGQFINLGIDHAGHLLILILVSKNTSNKKSAKPSFEKPKPPFTYQIWQTTDKYNTDLSLYAEVITDVNMYFVQRFKDGDILLVNARSVRRSHDDYDKNGYIYSTDGKLKNQFLLGDGIEGVQVTKDGVIWVSYFDEGIFGNKGWHDPIGSSGLVAWDTEGKKLYEFEPTAGLDRMCDCYALNVASNTITYAYYYTEFVLVRIQNQKITDYWQIPVSYSSAFITYDNHAVFRGGYNDYEHFYLVELQKEHQAEIMQQVIFEHEGENILKPNDVFPYAYARNDSFLVVKDKYLFVIPFSEFLG